MESGSWIPVVTALSAVVTTIATVMIWVYAHRSHQLAMALKQVDEMRTRKDEEFRQQLRDLYQAIVVATLLGAPAGVVGVKPAIAQFEALYTGKTEIFKGQRRPEAK